ncbi:MAG: response regulator [Deltaproteobacteria bacterium]|nr:response regulator [Deltaproteobacteria bacterium]
MNSEEKQDRRIKAPEFLSGTGEMTTLIRSRDWSKTSLGSPDTWPHSLNTVVRVMLSSRYAIWIGWGPELTFLYNDAYARMTLGKKHPWALGQPAREVWKEAWRDLGPRVDEVVQYGQATYDEDLLLLLERSGQLEETYHTFSYSPLPDDEGNLGGLLCIVTEDTDRYIAERRLKVLGELAAHLANARNEEELCAAIKCSLAANKHDLPFSLIYFAETDNQHARLVCNIGIDAGVAAAPHFIERDRTDGPWPVFDVLAQAEAVLVSDLADRFANLPCGAWNIAPRQALAVPIAQQSQAQPVGVIIIGLNPYRPLDDVYQRFINLLAGQIGAGLAEVRAYEQERKRAEALAEIDRAKTAFFSNASHEFRTPLTLMLSPLEELLARSARSPLVPVQRDEIELVHRNGLRLLRLVNTLLDFSRIEAGRMRAAYQPTDLASFTADLASVFRAAIERAGLRLVVDCPPLSQPVFVDHEMWEKIVLNLLSNAFKFTLAGKISISVRPVDNNVELRVADTGTGIPVSEMPRLFERFHRVENARGRTQERSGIGLALVHELVRLHGGSISVESVVGKGTSFIVTIPQGSAHLPIDQIVSAGSSTSAFAIATPYVEEALRWLPETANSQDPQATNDEDPVGYREALPIASASLVNASNRSRVLIADDNADMRQYLAHLLNEQYELKLVGNGQAALLMAKQWQPDLILADVMMPQLDGFGLLRAIRVDSALRDVPLIMLSARAGEESRIEGMAAGADDYLVKPFNARELTARIEAHLKMALMRREAAERANYRTAQFEILVNQAPVGIYLIDADFRIRQINPIAQLIFGDIPNLIGRDFDEVIHLLWTKEYADEIVQHFRHTLETGEAFAAPEIAQRRLDRNRTEYYEWRIDRILLPDGQYGVVCYFRDIAAQILARQELEESREALRRDDRRKSEFLSTLAHELRNPLAPIGNSLELLKRVDNHNPLAVKAQEIMQRQLSHMVRLIDDLLDISRITRDKLELRTARIELVSLVAQSIESCRPLLDQYMHQLNTVLPAESIYLHADPVRLTQVFQNLLDNACKYTPRGGTISVMLRSQGDMAIVSVRDTGIGIPPDRLTEVFEMFAQVHQGTDRIGLGIGLALVKRLVEMHKGTIEARSAGQGKGAEFIVRLPTLPAEHSMVQESSTNSSVGDIVSNSRRILVVDDNEDSAESLRQLLEMEGNQVEEAHDGQEALEAFQRFDPHVILLDIGLPKMNGYEVCQAIRRSNSKRRPLVIALTGWGQESDRQKSAEAGFDGHLVKPIDFNALAGLLT